VSSYARAISKLLTGNVSRRVLAEREGFEPAGRFHSGGSRFMFPSGQHVPRRVPRLSTAFPAGIRGEPRRPSAGGAAAEDGGGGGGGGGLGTGGQPPRTGTLGGLGQTAGR
jgi:hypothetical protein